MQIKKYRHLDRKADARKKFALGELILKMELDFLQKETNTLRGLLLEAKDRAEKNPSLIQKWTELGDNLKE